MKKLFAVADEYVRVSDWKVLSLLKICLLSLGMLFGMQIAPKHKKPVFWSCVVLFAVTYVPLMAKFFRLLTAKEKAE